VMIPSLSLALVNDKLVDDGASGGGYPI
jgi:hypothetical protein